MQQGSQTVSVQRYEAGTLTSKSDIVAQEVPVALVYNGISHAVMMATPKDLTHFALGFSLAENIIAEPHEIYGIDVVATPQGIEVQIELASRRFNDLKARRRSMTGRTGCGICGTEQLEQVRQPLPTLPIDQTFCLAQLPQALSYLKQVQDVGAETGCTHAAVWVDAHGEFIAGFEDIGRHVALDKLLGFRAKQVDQAGAVIVSSRASYEMVQKAATCGVQILIAVSAATSLAIETALRSQLTLMGFCRQRSGVIYSYGERLT